MLPRPLTVLLIGVYKQSNWPLTEKVSLAEKERKKASTYFSLVFGLKTTKTAFSRKDS